MHSPNRCETCLFISRRIRSRASGVKYAGRFSLPLRIVSIVFFLFSALNGGFPVNISYINAPKLHQSTALPWPLRVRISGALERS